MDLPPVPCWPSVSVRSILSSPCEPRFLSSKRETKGTYVAAGEVTTLKHELGDDTVELGARVAEALLASAESTEVLGRLGDDVVVELEVDAAGLFYQRPALAIACGAMKAAVKS